MKGVGTLAALAVTGALLVGNAPQAQAVGPGCNIIVHRLHDADGDENQPSGVNYSQQWGEGSLGEGDANLTKPTKKKPGGEIIATHDFDLGRITGGAFNGTSLDISWARLMNLDSTWPVGKIKRTTALIHRAAQLDTAIMVNINQWGTYGSTRAGRQMVNELYRAAQDHPHPQRVYFGHGQGMKQLHPDQASFYRYNDRRWTEAEMLADIRRNSVDIAAIPPYLWTDGVGDRVRDAGARAATASTPISDVKEAYDAGIYLIQTGNPEAAQAECD